MSYFIAIETPDLSYIDLDHLEKVRQHHITLIFFGNLTNPQSIVEKLRTVHLKPFTIKTSTKLGAFVNWKKVSVVFLPVVMSKELNNLHSHLHSLFDGEYNLFPSFIPHITLSRVSQPMSDDVKLKLQSLQIESMFFRVNKLYLFQSQIVDGRVVYKKILRIE